MSNVPRQSKTQFLQNSALKKTLTEAKQFAQVIMFYLAIILPAAYLPLLGGGFTKPEQIIFPGLLILHITSLVIGHGHDP
jgi:hypothetical protein